MTDPGDRIETRLIHAGQPPDRETGAVVTPIHPTTTYAQEGIGRHKGFEYSRTKNPTRLALERCIADLEGAKQGFAFASGMAAIATTMQILKAGDHVVCEENVYGGTVRYFRQVLAAFGLTFDFVDASDPKNVERAMRPATRMVFLETPTNPNLKLTDVAAVAEIARARNALVAVDNTFMSPYLQNPHALGADVVLHSATKYLGGHSDVMGGLVTTTRDALAERLGFLQNAGGGILSPFDSWMVLKGIKTLHVRMDRACANAAKVAAALDGRDDVAKVLYPGLASHPQHALAQRQARGFGAIVSFDLGDPERAKRFASSLRLCHLAESLGAVETLVTHPASMTHASVPKEIRERSGITDGLLRVSVGIEAVEDIVADIEQALDASSR